MKILTNPLTISGNVLDIIKSSKNSSILPVHLLDLKILNQQS